MCPFSHTELNTRNVAEYRNSRAPFGKDYRTKGVGHVIRDKAVNTSVVSSSLRRKFIPGVKRVAGSTRSDSLSREKKEREKERGRKEEARREIEKQQVWSLKRSRPVCSIFVSVCEQERLTGISIQC